LYLEFLCKFIPAAFSENIFFFTCVFTFEITHVFNHTENFMLSVLGHCPCPCCNECCSRVRRRHNNLLTVRQKLMYIKSHVPCTRRQIKQEIIKVSPFHFVKETVDHLTKHRPSPDHRCIFFYEKCH